MENTVYFFGFFEGGESDSYRIGVFEFCQVKHLTALKVSFYLYSNGYKFILKNGLLFVSYICIINQHGYITDQMRRINFFAIFILLLLGCSNSEQRDVSADSSSYITSEKLNIDIFNQSISVKESIPQSIPENYTDPNGLKQGIWKEHYPNGQIKQEESFKDGKLYGVAKYYDFKTAKIYLQRTFQDNQVITDLRYGKDGTITESHNKNGRPDSIFRYYYENGQLAEYGYYDNGRRVGEWYWYDKNGNVNRYAHYHLGLLQTGQFHGDATTAQTGEEYYGLFVENNQHILKRCILQVDSVHDSMLDHDKNTRTGKEVSVNYIEKPIFLFKGIQNIQEGPVKVAFHGVKYMTPEESLVLELGTNNKYELLAFADSTYIPHRYHIPFTFNYRLKISYNNQNQIIGFGKVHEEARPEIIWAGDLDNDNQLDLILNLRQFNGATYNLLLSSYAKKGELLKIVAEFKIIGC